MKRQLFERYHPLPFLTTVYKLLVTKCYSLMKGCERSDNNLTRIFLRHHFLRVIRTFLPSSFYTIARIVGLSFIHSEPAADKRFTLWPLLWKASPDCKSDSFDRYTHEHTIHHDLFSYTLSLLKIFIKHTVLTPYLGT